MKPEKNMIDDNKTKDKKRFFENGSNDKILFSMFHKSCNNTYYYENIRDNNNVYRICLAFRNIRNDVLMNSQCVNEFRTCFAHF